MSTDTEWEDATAPAGAEVGVSGSLLADLRRRAGQLRADDHIDLDVPGWRGMLKARYRALDAHRVEPILERATRRGEATNAAADVLAMALVDLFGVDERGTLCPLYLDRPARFDMELAGTLHLEPTEQTARGVLLALFGWPNDRAIGLVAAQVNTYSEWLNGTVDGNTPAQEVVENAVGESPGE